MDKCLCKVPRFRKKTPFTCLKQRLRPVVGLDPQNYIVSPKLVSAKGRTVD